jgi:hypothetical protein
VTRRHNPLRIKLDHSYTAAEIAERMDVHIRTVRKWIAKGLTALDQRVPHLFHGRQVQEFVRKLNKPYEPLGPGEFFCICCKRATRPAGGQVWLTPRSPMTADYTGACETCGRRLYRRVRISEVHDHIGSARLIHDDAATHISKGGNAHCDALERECCA